MVREVQRRALALKRWQGHAPIHSAEQLTITSGRTAPEKGKQWGDGFSETTFDGNVSSALNAALAASADALQAAAGQRNGHHGDVDIYSFFAVLWTCGGAKACTY